jgi:hypothetical protein
MIIAQNVLLRKLRLRTAEHVESSDFDHYLNLFKEGLTEDQVNLTREIFLITTSPAGDGTTLEEAA